MIEPTMPAMSLEEWRRAFSFHPWFFYGMATAELPLKNTQQDDLIRHAHAWQDLDAAGRDDIVEAIGSAERLLSAYLGYRIGPQYAEATLPAAQIGAPDAAGRWPSVALPEGKLIALGVETRTLVATASVAYTDEDSDGVLDTATITCATTVTDPAQLGVYVQQSDRLTGAVVDETSRIRPVSVSIASGTATITAPAWLFVRPITQQGLSVEPLNPADAGVLADAVDIYQRTTNGAGTTTTDGAVILTWETRPCHGWWCCCGCQDPTFGSPFDPAATATAVGRAAMRNADLGLVAPVAATYNSTATTWSAWGCGWLPDHATIRYLAGLPSPDGQQIQRAWQPVVARLAAAELGRPITASQAANRALAHWQFDVARSQGLAEEQYSISPGDLDNPFGTRRGHIAAWRYVSRVQHTRGVYAG